MAEDRVSPRVRLCQLSRPPSSSLRRRMLRIGRAVPERVPTPKSCRSVLCLRRPSVAETRNHASCRIVARNALPPAILASSSVAPKLPESCPRVCRTSAPGAELAQLPPSLPDLGQAQWRCRPSRAPEAALTSAPPEHEVCGCPRLSHVNLGQTRPASQKRGQIRDELGRSPTNTMSTSTSAGQSLTTAGANSARSKNGRSRKMLGRKSDLFLFNRGQSPNSVDIDDIDQI